MFNWYLLTMVVHLVSLAHFAHRPSPFLDFHSILFHSIQNSGPYAIFYCQNIGIEHNPWQVGKFPVENLSNYWNSSIFNESFNNLTTWINNHSIISQEEINFITSRVLIIVEMITLSKSMWHCCRYFFLYMLFQLTLWTSI